MQLFIQEDPKEEVQKEEIEVPKRDKVKEEKSLNKSLTSNQLLVVTMSFYFLSYITEGYGDLVSGGLGTIGFICLVLLPISFVREIRQKKEGLIRDLSIILVGYGFFLAVVAEMIV